MSTAHRTFFGYAELAELEPFFLFALNMPVRGICMRGWAWLIALLAVALPGILLAPLWPLGGLGAGEDDILYYYPARVWLRELATTGQFPYLNPWSGLDRPMLADPQHAVFYPTTWLFALLPPTKAYPASLWLHFSIAFLGMYRMLRGFELDRRAAIFGAIAFAFCGFMLAQRVHFTIQHTAAWTPWVFWRLTRLAAAGGGRRWAAAILVCGLQCLSGHIQIAALTALGSGVFLLFGGARARLGGKTRATLADAALRWTGAWIGGGLLAGIQLAPTLLFLQECTRGQRNYIQFTENSLWPQSALLWSLPMLFGQRTPNLFDQPWWGPSHQVEQFGYMGLMVLMLAAAAWRSGWRDQAYRRAWILLLAFGFLTALGLFGPIAPLLYLLPGASVFRVPARALLLINLAGAALAAGVLHDLGAKLSPRRAHLRACLRDWLDRPMALIAILIGAPLAAVLLFALLATPLGGFCAEQRAAAWQSLRPWNMAILLPLGLGIVTVLLLGACARKWREPWRLWLLPVVLALDLGIIGWTIDIPRFDDPRAKPLTSADREALRAALHDAQGRMWVVTGRTPAFVPGEYVDSYGKMVANTNILDHVKLLTDYGPLTPRIYDQAFGFMPWGEPRTREDAEAKLADEDWMQWHNIEWILLCEDAWKPPRSAKWVLTTQSGYRLYRMPLVRGMAYFENAAQPGAVRYVEHAPYHFTTHVDTWSGDVRTNAGPNPRLVVARLALPGWAARCNGKMLPIEPAGGILLSIRLPNERPLRIEWQYEPPGLWLGALLSTATLALCVFLAGSGVRHNA